MKIIIEGTPEEVQEAIRRLAGGQAPTVLPSVGPSTTPYIPVPRFPSPINPYPRTTEPWPPYQPFEIWCGDTSKNITQ